MDTIGSTWETLTASDGHQLRGYLAQPRGKEKGRVVVVQELLGVTLHIRAVCERYAAAGYRALAPAFFDRVEPGLELSYTPDDIQRGRAAATAIPMADSLLDADAALGHLGGTAAIVGYCWGGAIAWAGAARLKVSAAIIYYGAIGDRLDEAPRAPAQLHFGEHDHAIPVAVPREAGRRHPGLITHIYPAGHGFNCDERDSFHPESAVLAQRRSLGFLQAVF